MSGALAQSKSHYQVVDGIAIYFGVVPAELVRGHPREHAESQMHGGVPVGENHVIIALFDNASGKRITNAEIKAKLFGAANKKLQKNLERMVIGGNTSYGNYFYMPGRGPYRFELEISRPETSKIIRVNFIWARS